MRNLKQFMLLLMVVSLVTITGCKSDDDGGNPGAAGAGVITAKVNGVLFTSMEIASGATLVNAGTAQVLILRGSDPSGKAFTLTINGYEGVGTYEIDGNGIGFSTALYNEVNVSNPSASQSWLAPYDTTVNGTILISEASATNFKGTFEFVAENSEDNSLKTITEGSFNLNKV